MQDLTDTQDQADLRALWIKSYRPRIATVACPNCLPDCKRKSPYFFERGTVSGENGEALVAMRCNNCRYIRVSKPRKAREGMSKGQLQTLDRINRFFAPKGEKLAQWEVKKLDFGNTWSVVVRTEGNVYLSRGAHIFIRNHGRFEVRSVYDLCSSKEIEKSTKNHYEFMLRK